MRARLKRYTIVGRSATGQRTRASARTRMPTSSRIQDKGGIRMQHSGLLLPTRTAKPRTRGLTVLIDPGIPARYFEDVIESAEPFVDLVKFGWGTSVVTDQLERKIACLRS